MKTDIYITENGTYLKVKDDTLVLKSKITEKEIKFSIKI